MVAVSGGADSMALLRLLADAAPGRQWQLVVAHFNHQLRGRSSDADEAFVKRAARALGLRCVVGRWRKSRSRIKQAGLEMAAREARLAFLSRVAIDCRCNAVAMAHHADDQVELFFLRLLRGAGGGGMAGMGERGPFPPNPSIEIVRPLLHATKADILRFTMAGGIAFRDDASNTSLDHERNWIRHVLLPLLATRRAGLGEVVRRTMEIVSAETDCVRSWAQAWLGQRRRACFTRLPVAVQRQLMQIQLIALGIEPSFHWIESLRAVPDGSVTVAPGKTVRRDKTGQIHLVAGLPAAFLDGQRELSLGTKGTLRFGKVHIQWRLESGKPSNGRRARAKGSEFFDADRVGDLIWLRHWRPGDRFQPIGTKLAMKLQDLFVNQKIPAVRRRGLVIATTAGGEIFWVEGLRIGDLAKLRPSTRRSLAWSWRRS